MQLSAAGYESETRLRQGTVEKAISEIVEQTGADILIMGAYGHSRIRSMIIGSTTTSMIHSCLVPLLLFR